MKRVIKKLLDRLPYINGLREEIRMLREEVRKQGEYLAGHYHSPIPSEEDVREHLKSRKSPNSEIVGINMNKQSQYNLLNEYIQFYKDLPFPEKQTPERRYYYENNWFCHSDAIFLYSFLRKYAPRRIIEVGSGFSSAVMLDTIESYLSERTEITFIEPHPDRLISLLKEDDKQRVRLIDRKIQEVPLNIFSALDSDDLLFIDSSHVLKCGSDLQVLMFEIIPYLKPGVVVHFHDVFFPFEYPADWLINKGRYWNENYIMRAFLSYNSEWSILFFNTYVHQVFGDLIKEKMPLCLKDTGGSLYIQRRPKS
jgi:predicted O-methyltransferase YrrM